EDDSDGIYTGMYEFAEAGSTDISLCLSKMWYDDEWGQRWGAKEQYKFDGTVAEMGVTTQMTYEAGKYLFSYDSTTKITTYVKQS
ncbi:MAG: hypothetical protein PHX62_06435, partial [Bacilli bacterium]|nr:hypothetical protein [Bacilli bacterium]